MSASRPCQGPPVRAQGQGHLPSQGRAHYRGNRRPHPAGPRRLSPYAGHDLAPAVWRTTRRTGHIRMRRSAAARLPASVAKSHRRPHGDSTCRQSWSCFPCEGLQPQPGGLSPFCRGCGLGPPFIASTGLAPGPRADARGGGRILRGFSLCEERATFGSCWCSEQVEMPTPVVTEGYTYCTGGNTPIVAFTPSFASLAHNPLFYRSDFNTQSRTVNVRSPLLAFCPESFNLSPGSLG